MFAKCDTILEGLIAVRDTVCTGTTAEGRCDGAAVGDWRAGDIVGWRTGTVVHGCWADDLEDPVDVEVVTGPKDVVLRSDPEDVEVGSGFEEEVARSGPEDVEIGSDAVDVEEGSGPEDVEVGGGFEE